VSNVEKNIVLCISDLLTVACL